MSHSNRLLPLLPFFYCFFLVLVLEQKEVCSEHFKLCTINLGQSVNQPSSKLWDKYVAKSFFSQRNLNKRLELQCERITFPFKVIYSELNFSQHSHPHLIRVIWDTKNCRTFLPFLHVFLLYFSHFHFGCAVNSL